MSQTSKDFHDMQHIHLIRHSQKQHIGTVFSILWKNLKTLNKKAANLTFSFNHFALQEKVIETTILIS